MLRTPSESPMFLSDLEPVEAAFAQWRRGRRGGQPLPEALCARAVELA